MESICRKCFVLKVSDFDYANSGHCNFCGSDNVPVLRIDTWSEDFDQIFETYEIPTEKQDGVPLYRKIQNDWECLDGNLSDKKIKLFYAKCSTNVSDLRIEDSVIVKDYKVNSRNILGLWNDFKNEIIYKNRFFQGARDALLDFFEKAIVIIEDEMSHKTNIYRVRLWPSSEKLEKSAMLSPPWEICEAGRANPIGIPHLYAATKEDTAIKECRPLHKSRLSVATLRTKRSLKLLNLCKEFDLKNEYSPITLLKNNTDFSEGWQMLSNFLAIKQIFSKIGDDLSEALSPTDNQSFYVPTQFFCEFAKFMGYDGIMYKSAVHETGKNLVLFDSEDAEVVCLKHRQVTKIDIETCELNSNDLNVRNESYRIGGCRG
jgi:RES domain-containing protein